MSRAPRATLYARRRLQDQRLRSLGPPSATTQTASKRRTAQILKKHAGEQLRLAFPPSILPLHPVCAVYPCHARRLPPSPRPTFLTSPQPHLPHLILYHLRRPCRPPRPQSRTPKLAPTSSFIRSHLHVHMSTPQSPYQSPSNTLCPLPHCDPIPLRIQRVTGYRKPRLHPFPAHMSKASSCP
jgi:hypothetical protein